MAGRVPRRRAAGVLAAARAAAALVAAARGAAAQPAADAARAHERGAAPAGRPRWAPALRHYHHTRWAYPDGVRLGASVTRLARSADGYLWFGAQAALVRFDGARFTVLDGRADPALRPLRSGPALFVLAPAATRPHAGPTWIYTVDGALRAYERGTFRVVRPARPDVVRYADMFRDGAGGLWVEVDSAGRRSVRRWRDGAPAGAAWPAEVPTGDLLGVVPDTADGAWMGTTTGQLWHVTPRGARRIPVPAAATGGGANLMVRPYLQSRDGTLWVGGTAGYRVRDGRWTPVLAADRTPIPFSEAAEAPDGSVYLATVRHGLVRWRDGGIERPDPTDPATAEAVGSVLVDPDGTVWATTEKGVERYRPPTFVMLGPRDGVPVTRPHAIAADDSAGLWVARDLDGPSLYRLTGGPVRGAPGPAASWRARLPRGLSYLVIAGDRGGVWLAPLAGGLLHVSRRGVVRVDVAAQGGVPRPYVVDGVVGRDGSLWVEHLRSGIGRVRGGRYAPVRLPGLDTMRASVAVDRPRGFVVVAGRQSPLVYGVTGGEGYRRLDGRVPLRRPLVRVAVEGADTVWGVPAQLDAIVRITGGRATELPLPGPVLPHFGGSMWILTAGGSLWFGSPSGIGRYSLAALHAAADRGRPAPPPQRFSTADGLAVDALASGTHAHLRATPDGRVWLATQGGLAVVDPRAIRVNRAPPPVIVEEVTVAGLPVRRDTPAPGAALRLPPHPGRVTIHYTSTSMRASEHVRFEYQLDGADRGWVRGTAARAATYTQLRPGRYRFRVRAWNEDGVPSAGEATLALRVLPAWYQTWWATALGAAGVAGAGAAAAANVGRARRRRAELAVQAALAERVRVARELHDTLLADMTGVALRLDGVALRAGASAGTDGAVPAALAELRDQVRHTLAETRRAVTAMRDTGDDLVPLWAQLGDAAHRIFADADVDVRVEHTGRPRRIAPGVLAEVVRIASEAMANARRHAGGRALVVVCAFGPRELRVRVRDDGRGFDPARAAADGHFGLTGMRERAAAIGARLTVESAPGRGTTVLLVVPLARGG